MITPETTRPQVANSVARDRYVAFVLSLYLGLPDTPAQAKPQDRQQAQRWFAEGVPGQTVETALLLASLRRRLRARPVPPLAPIRSLAYFQPVIAELLPEPARPGYLDYLGRKLDCVTRQPS